jgi:hypothetical protein
VAGSTPAELQKDANGRLRTLIVAAVRDFINVPIAS